jgi:hypothetical protein
MKKIIYTTRLLLYMIFSFYTLMALFLTVSPEHRNLFTLVSCLTTIGALAIGSVFSGISSILKKNFDITLIFFSFCGMLTVYTTYLIVEFNIISTSFNLLSLGFDFFTSLFSYLIINSVRGYHDSRN